MAEHTAIAWTDHTSGAWIGCTRVGPGCDNCYAEALDRTRFSKTLGGATKEHPIVHWGVGAPRYERLKNFESDIRLFNRKAIKAYTRRRVFVNSMADFFDNEVPQAWRNRALDVMVECEALDFQLLTKRPGNIRKMIPVAWMSGGLPKNFWLGATIATQQEAKRDIATLLDVPAKVRFLSCEPLIEALDLRGPLATGELHWVICGGESGSKARASSTSAGRAHCAINAPRLAPRFS
jgi:protein gp37